MSPFIIFVLGVLALGGLIGLASWFTAASPNRLARGLKFAVLALVVGLVVLFLFVNPRLVPIAALIGIPFLLYRLGLFGRRPGRAPGGFGGGSDPTSRVETQYLRMSLDRASGVMTGEVLRGSFAGRPLESLDLGELLQLRLECERDDPQSLPLIEAYLDRRFGTDWRQQASQSDGQRRSSGEDAPRAGASEMTRAEALEILGLQEGADRDAIVSAWRRLIKLAHPDHGGSKYLAAKLNEAKRVLLGE